MKDNLVPSNQVDQTNLAVHEKFTFTQISEVIDTINRKYIGKYIEQTTSYKVSCQYNLMQTMKYIT